NLRNLHKEINDKHFIVITVDCISCGNYRMDYSLAMAISKIHPTFKPFLPYLSCYTRQESEKGNPPVIITEENWLNLAKLHTNTSPSQNLKKLLQFIKTRAGIRHEDFLIKIELDYPIIDVISSSEFDGFIDHVSKNEYINCLRDRMN